MKNELTPNRIAWLLDCRRTTLANLQHHAETLTMRLPKFTAEASLGDSGRHYTTASSRVPVAVGGSAPLSLLTPAAYFPSLVAFPPPRRPPCCTPPRGGCCSGTDADGFPCGCCNF